MVSPRLVTAAGTTRPAPTARLRARPGPVLGGVVAILVAATFIPLGYVAWSVVVDRARRGSTN